MAAEIKKQRDSVYYKQHIGASHDYDQNGLSTLADKLVQAQ